MEKWPRINVSNILFVPGTVICINFATACYKAR